MVDYRTVRGDLLVGIIDCPGDIAFLIGIPVHGTVVSLIYQLGVGGESFHDSEKEIAVITHILA